MFLFSVSATTEIYALSRHDALPIWMARICPPELITQFFGLYALSGTATAFLAPLLVGFFTDTFESQRAGFASLIGLLVVGFVMMSFVKEEQSTRH